MFSVIIPVHNKLPHLDRSVNSVLGQTFGDFELIIIDDASSDGSSEKLKGYIDPRIRLLQRTVPGPGGYAARNLGIESAMYDWIAFLDADDEWDVNYLNECQAAIRQHDQVDIISSKWVYSSNERTTNVQAFNKIISRYYQFSLIDYFTNNLIIWTSAVIIRKHLLIDAGLFPAGKCKRSGDMDTWIRCLNKSAGNIFINKPLAMYYRDTINRVTDFSWNPSLDFCPLETINTIRSETKDKRLLKAIDKYCSKHIQSRIVKGIRANNSIDTSSLNIISSKRMRIEIIIKVYLYKLLMILGVR